MAQLLFSVNDRPFGKSWGQWSIEWWKWRVPTCMIKNPGYYQYNSDVIFLPYSAGYPEGTEHQLTLPSGKSLFFPVIAAINSYAEDKVMKSDQDLIEWSKEDIARIARKEVTINGEPLEQQQVCSEPFDIEYPSENKWNGTPGPTRAISAGYWTFLCSLPPGNYQINTHGACLAGKIKRDAAYDLVIQS
jgi:hypothetical protein